MQWQVPNMIANGRTALIALGSNEKSVWGDPAQTVQKAMEQVARLAQHTVRKSNLYSTPAFPSGAGPAFVNAAMAIHTNASPERLLADLHEIEGAAKRNRQHRWGPRTLDIDLIGMDDLVVPDDATHAAWRNLPTDAQQQQAPDQLILPHPRVQDRAFVLVPLAEVAPDWRHPTLGGTVEELLGACPANDLSDIVRLSAPG